MIRKCSSCIRVCVILWVVGEDIVGSDRECLGHWMSDTSSAVHLFWTCKMAHTRLAPLVNVGCVCLPFTVVRWTYYLKDLVSQEYRALDAYIVYCVLSFVSFPSLISKEDIVIHTHILSLRLNEISRNGFGKGVCAFGVYNGNCNCTLRACKVLDVYM